MTGDIRWSAEPAEDGADGEPKAAQRQQHLEEDGGDRVRRRGEREDDARRPRDLDDLGVGRTAREKHWAAWGFAAGFGANVAIAKCAQMATGAPFTQFIGPLLLGGVVAGVCCAAIGWGAAKLREPA